MQVAHEKGTDYVNASTNASADNASADTAADATNARTNVSTDARTGTELRDNHKERSVQQADGHGVGVQVVRKGERVH